jgi:hypothetical protein
MPFGPYLSPPTPKIRWHGIEMRRHEDAGQQAERVSDRHASRETGLIHPVWKVERLTSKHHRARARSGEHRAGVMTCEDR